MGFQNDEQRRAVMAMIKKKSKKTGRRVGKFGAVLGGVGGAIAGGAAAARSGSAAAIAGGMLAGAAGGAAAYGAGGYLYGRVARSGYERLKAKRSARKDTPASRALKVAYAASAIGLPIPTWVYAHMRGPGLRPRKK